MNIVFRAGPVLARGSRADRAGRSATTPQTPGGHHAHAVGPRRRRRRAAREPRGEPRPADLPRARSSCSCSSRSGCGRSSGRCSRSCRSLIAVGLASIVAYAFDLKLSPMTAVGGPLVIAACTEFTSLILLRFVEERGRGSRPREAMDVTASRTGRAFIVSALTAICRRRGALVLVASAAARLRSHRRDERHRGARVSALVVLPPMLVWADRRNLVSRGLIKNEAAVRGGTAGALPRARDGFVTTPITTGAASRRDRPRRGERCGSRLRG